MAGSTMRWMMVCLCCALASRYAQGRQDGDLLAVGELVRFHMFVEDDYYLTVSACGSHQCGGIRVEGVDAKGMGFFTFQRDAHADPRSIKWRTHASPFGTVFLPGREYTFAVFRPTEHEMQLWLEGQEGNMAHVRVDAGPVRLQLEYDHGVYWFLDNEDDKAGAPVNEEECPAGGPEKLEVDENEEGVEVLEVSIGCRYTGSSKIQSMCIAYLAVEGQKSAQEVYRSKVSQGHNDPPLQEKVKLPFRFSEPQNLIINVYDAFTECEVPSDAGLIGTLQTPLATVNRNGEVALTLKGEYSVQFSLDCDEKITLDLSGRNIPGNGDVYLKILKSIRNVSGNKNLRFEEVTQTEKVPRDINFVQWNNITFSVKALCDGDLDRPLKVYALEDNEGDVTLLGYFMTSVSELKRSQSTFFLIDNNQKALMGDTYNNSGEIYIGEVPQKATFSKYMSVGFELVGTMQIDFTASNSFPTPPLHHLSDKPNHYQLAIQSIGEIVEKFVADGLLKAYGFGANLPGQSITSFDFYLNLSASTPDCDGVTGVLAAYKETVGQLDLSGPTEFAPAIRKIVGLARQYKDGSKYFVHLLMTDGRLEDPNETKKAILEASALPISIIIVGIGDADLSVLRSMATQSQGETSSITFWNEGERNSRDILQFVAMNDFKLGESNKVKSQLQHHVLNKIPPQYLEYMKINKIAPKPPRNTTITRVCG